MRYGSSRYVIGNHTYPIKKGDLIVTNSDVLHDNLLEKDDYVSYFALGIGDLRLEGLEANHLIDDKSCPVIPAGEHYSAFDHLFKTIYELIASGESGMEETCHYLMMSIISLALHLISEAEPGEEPADISSMITEVRHYLDENYMRDISLKSVGSLFHVSPFHLSHVFKEETGYSLMNYVIRRRIGEAQTLLISTNDSITSIAGRVGFGNPNNFNIQFQKQVGLSPRQYRKIYVAEKKSKK